jgi:hypothetical protein
MQSCLLQRMPRWSELSAGNGEESGGGLFPLCPEKRNFLRISGHKDCFQPDKSKDFLDARRGIGEAVTGLACVAIERDERGQAGSVDAPNRTEVEAYGLAVHKGLDGRDELLLLPFHELVGGDDDIMGLFKPGFVHTLLHLCGGQPLWDARTAPGDRNVFYCLTLLGARGRPKNDKGRRLGNMLILQGICGPLPSSGTAAGVRLRTARPEMNNTL